MSEPNIVNSGNLTRYTVAVLRRIAVGSNVHKIIITSTARTSAEQAKVMYKKHVVENKPYNYKSRNVPVFMEKARKMHVDGKAAADVLDFMATSILKAPGGPQSVSKHIADKQFIEVFDIAHWGMKDGKRVNYLKDDEAKRVRDEIRKLVPMTILRVGFSSELSPVPPHEFKDEKCFHLEIPQPSFDKISLIPPEVYV